MTSKVSGINDRSAEQRSRDKEKLNEAANTAEGALLSAKSAEERIAALEATVAKLQEEVARLCAKKEPQPEPPATTDAPDAQVKRVEDGVADG